MAYRVAFMGQKSPYSVAAFNALISSSRVRGAQDFALVLVVEGHKQPIGRKQHVLHRANSNKPSASVEATLCRAALEAGIDCLQTCDVNAAYVTQYLQSLQLDAVICAGFDCLFGPELLSCAPVSINAHPSALPELRGPSPLFWALRQGLSQTAVTLHQIDACADHGMVYAQQPLHIPARITGRALCELAGKLAGSMLVDALGLAQWRHLCGLPQYPKQVSQAPRPTPEDALIDATAWSCQHVLNFACGAPYFRTPWMRMGDDTFYIRQGLNAQVGQKMPAQYILYNDTLLVQCRDGTVHVTIQI